MYMNSASSILRIFNRFAGYIDRGAQHPGLDGMNVSPVFIVGPPRSGTTLAYQLVSQQFDLAYFNHFMDILYGMPNTVSRISKLLPAYHDFDYTSSYGRISGILSPTEHPGFWYWCGLLRPDSSHLTEEDSLAQSQIDMIRSIINSITAIRDKQYIFKCLYLTYNIRLLAKILPSSGFIVLDRDPFTVSKSLYLARSRNTDDRAWWSVRPPGYTEVINKPLAEQVVFQTTATISAIDNSLNDLDSSRYIRIKYCDICNNTASVLSRLSEWLQPLGIRQRDNIYRLPQFNASEGGSLNKNDLDKLLAAWDEFKD